jgi:hypothetical protein
MLLLKADDLKGHLRRDIGVAVTVAAYPAPEGERGTVGLGSEEASPLGEQVLDDRTVQGVKVIDRIAGLVERVWLDHPEIVGQPQTLDNLGQATIIAPARAFELVGDLAEVVENRPPGCLGRMGGKHRADLDPGRGLSELLLV